MSSSMSNLDQGHEHANSAAEYYSRGLLIPAAAEHKKAADAFKTCVEQQSDEHTKNTLRTLYAHHTSVYNDLQRRIARLKEEGKDPSLPQLPPVSRSTSKASDVGLAAQNPLRGRNLESLTNTFDESFMVLNQQTEPSGEESPFDLFWKVTGEIMVNLSQPMSFQTAAMAALDAVESRSSPARANQEAKLNESTMRGSRRLGKSVMAASKHASRSKADEDFQIDDEDYDSSDSFCLIPSTSESENTASRLKKENSALKSRLEAMEKQMATVQKQITQRNEQDQHLRDNIMLARKEAQRAMAASTAISNPQMQSMMSLAGLNINVPQPGGGRDREAQFLKRIRELEEEVRTVRAENDKQRAMIAKFRERWERLKESAKRKKSAKAAEHADSVRERIDEDPEAEEAATAEDTSRDGS